MFAKKLTVTLSLLFAAMAVLNTGCFFGTGPTLGILSVPIPVSAHLSKKLEDEFHFNERYGRVPIMGPITAGGPVKALDPPSDDEVWRALERARPVQGGIPFLNETQRNNVVFVKEKIADYIDPAHYKCTVYFSEKKIVSWPVPHTLHDKESVEVLYIDHNHFHMVGNLDFGKSSTHY